MGIVRRAIRANLIARFETDDHGGIIHEYWDV